MKIFLSCVTILVPSLVGIYLLYDHVVYGYSLVPSILFFCLSALAAVMFWFLTQRHPWESLDKQ